MIHPALHHNLRGNRKEIYQRYKDILFYCFCQTHTEQGRSVHRSEAIDKKGNRQTNKHKNNNKHDFPQGWI